VAHPFDQPGAENERDQQRRQRGERGPEGDVPEHVEADEGVTEAIQQVVQH
jgi:hypothetical protein